MDAELLASFLVAALIIQLVPGPGMLFILAQGMAGGPRAGVAAALGAAAGMMVHTIAAVAGLAALFAHVPVAYDVLRIGGALYLLWLAVGHLRGTAALGERPAVAAPSTRRVFVRAGLNNLANPKVILFYLAFLPQFVDRELGAVPVQLLALGVVFLAIGLVLDLAIGTLAGRLGDVLRRRRGLRRAIDRVAATVLGALGIRILVTDR
jgi:threonine/homoserine/homoserine lactone efflux protein